MYIVRPSFGSTLRPLRTLPFVLLSLLLTTGPVVGQDLARGIREFREREARERADYRAQRLRDSRYLFDHLELTSWRAVAHVVIQLTPHEDGSATLGIDEQDRPKLWHAPHPLYSPPGRRQPDGPWFFFCVTFNGGLQEVSCSIPEPLRTRPVTLGIFRVVEDELECFVRDGHDSIGDGTLSTPPFPTVPGSH